MSVPGRIRTLRTQRGLTLEDLADAVGVHKGHLSRIERGAKTPSLGTLETIAAVLNVSMGQLFGEQASDDEVTLVRQADRTVLGDKKDHVVEKLLTASQGNRLTAYVITPGGEFLEHDVPHHEGFEMIYALGGRIELSVGGRTIELREGDCVAYDASLDHKVRKAGRAKASALVVITRS